MDANHFCHYVGRPVCLFCLESPTLFAYAWISTRFAVVTFALAVESFVAFGCHPTSPFLEPSPLANVLSSLISYLVG
jgi:hypothetical protein